MRLSNLSIPAIFPIFDVFSHVYLVASLFLNDGRHCDNGARLIRTAAD